MDILTPRGGIFGGVLLCAAAPIGLSLEGDPKSWIPGLAYIFFGSFLESPDRTPTNPQVSSPECAEIYASYVVGAGLNPVLSNDSVEVPLSLLRQNQYPTRFHRISSYLTISGNPSIMNT